MGIAVLLVGISVGCASCGRNDGPAGRGPALPDPNEVQRARSLDEPEFIGRVKGCSTDDEKWGIIVEAYGVEPRMKGEGRVQKARRLVRYLIRSCSCNYPFVYYYPEVTKHVAFEPKDLRQIGASLGSRQRDHWGLGGGLPGHVVSEYTKGEVAAAWLKYLIGRTFADRAAFERWLVEHESLLYWDQEAGRFGLPEAKGEHINRN